MKIAMMDPNTPKFTQDMVDWWEAQGHEVKRDRYYNPEFFEWADVIWFDTCDNNLKCGSYPDKNDPTQQGWDMHEMDLSNTRVICRIIDIEAWYGHHNNVDWNLVDDVIFIAPHIEALVRKDIDFEAHGVRVHQIPCGVNIDHFSFMDKPKGTDIAWVCERWPSKGIDYMLQILKALPKDYKIHALGRWNDIYAWETAYFYDFLDRNDLADRFIITEWVDDVADFLKDKHYILSCSKKEAFGYNIAEGMAMGLKPVIHNYFGAPDQWPSEYRWDSIEEAVNIITSDKYNPQQYRNDLIHLEYTIPQMMQSIMKLIEE